MSSRILPGTCVFYHLPSNQAYPRTRASRAYGQKDVPTHSLRVVWNSSVTFILTWYWIDSGSSFWGNYCLCRIRLLINLFRFFMTTCTWFGKEWCIMPVQSLFQNSVTTSDVRRALWRMFWELLRYFTSLVESPWSLFLPDCGPVFHLSMTCLRMTCLWRKWIVVSSILGYVFRRGKRPVFLSKRWTDSFSS